jgi:hypothetical protein
MAQEELRNPFVMQCKACNTVVGDSFSLKDFKHGMLVLSTVSSTTIVEDKKILSDGAFDSNCWFCTIKCRCQKAIGRKYVTVNVACGGFAGTYCIDQDSVYTYALGTASTPREFTLAEAADEIERLQRFCVYLYKRIEGRDPMPH